MLLVLEARGLAVNDSTRVLIESCDKPDQLGQWVVRACNAKCLCQIFG
ncbi:hypothetical protein [Glycomyces sp. NRRL B-16210]|nr:hypothetical protein [Glycomyces sp. NRRL B-16210]